MEKRNPNSDRVDRRNPVLDLMDKWIHPVSDHVEKKISKFRPCGPKDSGFRQFGPKKSGFRPCGVRYSDSNRVDGTNPVLDRVNKKIQIQTTLTKTKSGSDHADQRNPV